MKRIKPTKLFTLTLLIGLVSMMFSIQVSAADTKDLKETGALTTPPPQLEPQTQAVDTKVVKEIGALTTPPPKSDSQTQVANPNFKYLYDTSISISDMGSLKVKLQAMTMAYESVNAIGVDLSLERWTGSTWISVQSTTLSSTLTDYYTSTVQWTATEGFYYRGRSNHWVKKGTVKEEQVLYTNTLLISK